MDELRNCQICNQPYDLRDRNRLPKLLPCGKHSGCAKCVMDIMRGTQNIECPIDKARHTIRFEDIPNTRPIMDFLQSSSAGVGGGAGGSGYGGGAPYPTGGGGNQGFVPMPTLPMPNMPPGGQAPYNAPSGFGGASQPQFPGAGAGYNAPPSFGSGGQPQFPGAGGGYNAPPPYASSRPTVPPSYNNNNSQSGSGWDDRKYLKGIFDEIDHNHDGEISGNELHEALRRGQPNSQFDPRTVRLLIEKYDKNHDQEINFPEFYDLFVSLNNQFNDFLDIDRDFSGSIDGAELGNSLRNKGFNFSRDLYEFIAAQISRSTGTRGITFDLYVRVIARFDFLRAQFNRSNPNYGGVNQNYQMESYIRDSFFSNF